MSNRQRCLLLTEIPQFMSILQETLPTTQAVGLTCLRDKDIDGDIEEETLTTVLHDSDSFLQKPGPSKDEINT